MRVEWVHPSWRDLVIGRLAGDPPARRRFLSRCGVHGVVLAVSTAGGVAGERQLPLLRDDADWDTLGDRIHALLGELEPVDLLTVLMALDAAVADTGGPEVIALARMALERVARRWDAEGAPIPLVLLDVWLGLARRLHPPPAAPSLAVTWADLLPVAVPALADRAEVERFADWLALCALLDLGRPADWSAFILGADGIALARAFVKSLAGAVDTGDGPDLRGTADALLRALDAIAALEPALGSAVAVVARRLRSDAEIPEWRPAQARHHARAERLESAEVRRVLADL